MMGVAMELSSRHALMSPEMRLLATTGFLGGLTTFSTFSGEAVTLLLRQQYLWFGGHVLSHLAGSLGMTVLGLALTRNLLRH